ncbi:hypothetical protein FKW77_001586 [Venturia effusa]|uniref:Aminotransferase class V domain-containing protein n=1 Tax=Venturia effusa TaxID=50376 RepID=A0A517L4Y5_9PEZI|nr:hypothetical protein FKW77_001586 [Venturia effusa]
MEVAKLAIHKGHLLNGSGNSSDKVMTFGRVLKNDFLFDKEYRNLNHGSFGTYPSVVRDVFRSFQDQAEARPDQFILYDYPKALDASRAAMARFLNVPVETITFVPNATTGINTVMRNLVFKPKDKILHFSTIYGACGKTVSYITETTPAEAVIIEYTHPVSDQWLVEEFKRVIREEQAARNNVKVAIFDTVVSMPGVRAPFEQLVAACKELGVLSCVDGAHGVGHIDLDLGKLDCDFFVSNCHKWLFVPRGCAVFYVPVRNQHLIRSTLPTSHGFTPLPSPGGFFQNPLPPSSKSAYITNFEFVGTIDNAPYLCIPAALEYRQKIGGEAAIRGHCHRLARSAAKIVSEALGTEVLENKEGTLGNCCMSNVRLPLPLAEIASMAKTEDVGMLIKNWIYSVLLKEFSTFMFIIWDGNAWWVRFSAQVYLEEADFEWAAKVLKEVCGRVMDGEFLGEKS